MDDSIYKQVRIKIGRNYKKFRAKEKLSLRKVEAITGVDHSWIAKFEKGQVNFEIDTLLKLVSGLKIHIRDVIDFPHNFIDD